MKEKTKLQKIKELLLGSEEEQAKVELMQMPLKDKEAMLEAESFEEGQPVFIVNEDERIPLPMGEYQMDDGQVLKVEEEGIIASIGKMEEPMEKENEAEVAASEKPEETPVAKKVVESQVKETHFSKEEREALKTELKAEILAELSNQKEEEKEEKEEVELSKPIQHNPENKQENSGGFIWGNQNKKKGDIRSKVYEMINK